MNVRCLVMSLALPAAVIADARLENAAFDQFGDDGKPEAWSLSGKFRIARGDGHNGSGGLCWEADAPCGKLHTARQVLQGVKPGDLISFEMLVKKEGFRTTGSHGAVFSIEMRDANDKWIRALYATTKSVKDGEWTRVCSSGLVPANTKNAVVVIYVSGDSQGRVAWDNIVVRKMLQDPVSFVCTSVYRGIAAEGKADFHASIAIPEKCESGRIEAFFSWKGADGVAVRRPAERLTKDEASITLDVSTLAFGRQDVKCELLADGKAIGSASTPFTRVEAMPRRHVWMDRHGRCIVNGKPFFPLGMYWNPNERNMAAFTNGPFNCVVHYEMMTPRRLDFCRAHGLMSLSTIDHKLWKVADDAQKADEAKAARAKLAAAIAAIKDHPALLGWYVGDEVDAGSVPRQRRRYGFITECDPDHPTYAVQDRTYDLRAFLPTADVIGLDPYPVAQKPLRMVTDFMRQGKVALFGARPLWSVPQAFSWQWYRKETKDTERCPTLAEMRSMNWQHIANGANGLFSFAYHSYFYPLNRQDWRPLWANAVAANREVAKMIPVLLSVEPAPAARPDTEELVCRTWMKGGELYLLACNISSQALYASVDLSEGRWRMAGTEVGSPATMDGDAKVRFYLDPIGVSFVRLVRAN